MEASSLGHMYHARHPRRMLSLKDYWTRIDSRKARRATLGSNRRPAR